MTPACARLILSIYPPRLPFPPPTYGPAPYPLLRASDTSARLIPPEEELRASDTSARLVACARLILSIYPPPPSPPPTYGPAPYPLLRASDTSPAGYLRASDTCSASNVCMDTSTRLVACARLILSIYPPPPSPPPTYLPAPYPLLRASDTSARLIPPPRDTSARLIPPPVSSPARV